MAKTKIDVFGLETIKSFFRPSLPNITPIIDPSTYRGFDGVGDSFMNIDTGHGDYHFHANCPTDYVYAYFNCSPLAAIINRKAQAFNNGRIRILDLESDGTTGQMATSDTAKKIKDLLDNPNPKMTRRAFMAQLKIYIDVFGFCPVLIQKPFGFPNVDAEMLWNIPPHMVEITETGGIFYTKNKKGIKSIVLTYKGERSVLPLDNVFIFTDATVSFESVDLPDSRLKSLKMPINNIIGSYESRNTLINSRGALGMITNKTKDSFSSIPLQPQEKKDLLSDFAKMYGMKRNQSKFILTSADLNWQSMVLSTKELMLFEEVVDDINRICDVLNYPRLLLNQSDGATQSNLGIASRELYENGIIPESDNIFEQWGKLFNTESYKLFIDNDYSHLNALQPDAKLRAEARLRMNQGLQIEFKNNVITLNQWRELNGDKPIEGDDLYYYQIMDRFVLPDGQVNPGVNVEDDNIDDNLNPRGSGDALNID